MPEPDFIEGVRPVAREAPRAAPAPPPAGALRKPEIAIRNVDWLTPREDTPAPGSAFRRFLRYLVVFLVLALITAWMFAPALTRAWLVTGASARGIVLTIERVDVSRRSVRLSDVRAESPELPGATMRTGTIVIGLRWLLPETITFDDAEVSVDGAYSTLSTRLDQYRARHGTALARAVGSVHSIEVTSGRIDWKNLIGADTSALVENVTLEVGKNSIRALGDDYHLSAPLFTMRLAGAPAGPWQLDVERQGILVRSKIRFDPSGTYPASVTRTVGDDGSVSVSLQVPPTTLADLHLPAAIFGGAVTDKTRLEAHGDINIVAVQETTTRSAAASAVPAAAGALAVPAPEAGAPDAGTAAPPPPATSRSVSGRIGLAAGGLVVFPSGPLVDLSLDLPFTGDTARPIAVSGVLALAPTDPSGGASAALTSAVLTGTLDMSGVAARVEMAGTTGPIACVKGPGPAAKAGVTGLRAEIVGSFDDLSGARVHFVPASACAPKLR